MPAESRENPLLKIGNSDAFFREKYLTKNTRLDLLLGVDYVRDAVCIGFIANEALSIVENAGLMGMPLPEAVRKGIDVLKSTSESGVSGYGKP